jgi:hypothetical protein
VEFSVAQRPPIGGNPDRHGCIDTGTVLGFCKEGWNATFIEPRASDGFIDSPNCQLSGSFIEAAGYVAMKGMICTRVECVTLVVGLPSGAAAGDATVEVDASTQALIEKGDISVGDEMCFSCGVAVVEEKVRVTQIISGRRQLRSTSGVQIGFDPPLQNNHDPNAVVTITKIDESFLEPEQTVCAEADGFAETDADQTSDTIPCGAGFTGVKSRACGPAGTWADHPDLSNCVEVPGQIVCAEADGFAATNAGETSGSIPCGAGFTSTLPSKYEGLVLLYELPETLHSMSID